MIEFEGIRVARTTAGLPMVAVAQAVGRSTSWLYLAERGLLNSLSKNAVLHARRFTTQRFVDNLCRVVAQAARRPKGERITRRLHPVMERFFDLLEKQEGCPKALNSLHLRPDIDMESYYLVRSRCVTSTLMPRSVYSRGA